MGAQLEPYFSWQLQLDSGGSAIVQLRMAMGTQLWYLTPITLDTTNN